MWKLTVEVTKKSPYGDYNATDSIVYEFSDIRDAVEMIEMTNAHVIGKVSYELVFEEEEENEA